MLNQNINGISPSAVTPQINYTDVIQQIEQALASDVQKLQLLTQQGIVTQQQGQYFMNNLADTQRKLNLCKQSIPLEQSAVQPVEEQIPQIRLQYETMSESFKEIATNSDQNIFERVNTFLKMYSNGAISLNTSSDGNKGQPIHNDNDARTSEFSGKDIGEASYDADTALCVEADRIVQEIQRSDMENGRSK